MNPLDDRPALQFIKVLLDAWGWPQTVFMVVVFCSLAFRRALIALIPGLELLKYRQLTLKFAKKSQLDIEQFEIELKASWRLGQERIGNDSTEYSILHQIGADTRSDYFVVDLGKHKGTGWLTSRLYILLVLLIRLRGLRAIVFVDVSEKGSMFVGWCDAETLRWTMASKYQHLEYAFLASPQPREDTRAREYDRSLRTFSRRRQGDAPTPPARIVKQWYGYARPDFLDPTEADYIIDKFFKQIRADIIDEKDNDGKWIDRGNGQGFEHAEWVTTELLREMMGETLVTDSIELGRKKDTELVKLILEKEGDFVAITKNRLFWNLGDRKDLVEQSVRRFTRKLAG